MNYCLRWHSLPMGALENFQDWYIPELGQGVYMLVVCTTNDNYIPFYIGKSNCIGRRWYEHLFDEYLNPNDEIYVPNIAQNFLEDSLGVFNRNELQPGLEHRSEVQRAILDQTWFCYSELRPQELFCGDKLEHIEYVLQEALKQHLGIKQYGWIGEGQPQFRQMPIRDITLFNDHGNNKLAMFHNTVEI